MPSQAERADPAASSNVYAAPATPRRRSSLLHTADNTVYHRSDGSSASWGTHRSPHASSKSSSTIRRLNDAALEHAKSMAELEDENDRLQMETELARKSIARRRRLIDLELQLKTEEIEAANSHLGPSPTHLGSLPPEPVEDQDDKADAKLPHLQLRDRMG
jgi:hypothetical protein